MCTAAAAAAAAGDTRPDAGRFSSRRSAASSTASDASPRAFSPARWAEPEPEPRRGAPARECSADSSSDMVLRPRPRLRLDGATSRPALALVPRCRLDSPREDMDALAFGEAAGCAGAATTLGRRVASCTFGERCFCAPGLERASGEVREVISICCDACASTMAPVFLSAGVGVSAVGVAAASSSTSAAERCSWKCFIHALATEAPRALDAAERVERGASKCSSPSPSLCGLSRPEGDKSPCGLKWGSPPAGRGGTAGPITETETGEMIVGAGCVVGRCWCCCCCCCCWC